MALDGTTVEFDVKFPVDELFKTFVEALKGDAVVEFESKDRENGKITMRVMSSNILRNYKTFRVVTSITSKEDGDGIHVIWTLVYVKINDDINTPSRRSVEFDVKSPADELFKTFTKSLIRDAEVAIEFGDWDNRRTRIRMTNIHILEHYKSLKVTTSITPKEDGEGSHVKWTIKLGRIPDDFNHPDLCINTPPNPFEI